MPSKKWDLEHRDFLRIYQRNYQQAKTKIPEEKLKLQNHKKILLMEISISFI